MRLDAKECEGSSREENVLEMQYTAHYSASGANAFGNEVNDPYSEPLGEIIRYLLKLI